MSEIQVRVREAPRGGARVAWSYLGTVLGAVLGALLWAVWSQFDAAACGDADDLQCRLGWVLIGLLVGLVAGWAPIAWVLRLGWEWWLVLATAALSVPLWVDLAPGWVPAVVAVLAPAVAALVTGLRDARPAWRPWVLGGVAVLVLAGTLLVVLV